MSLILPCHFCRQPILSLADYLILNHPKQSLPRAFFAHLACGSEHDESGLGGYGIELRTIVRFESRREGDNSLDGWMGHLWKKNWFNPGLALAVVDAHELAKGIHDTATVTQTLRAAKPASSAVRDARQKVTGKVRAYVFARDGHQCVRCGGRGPLVIDHILPVSRGGSGEVENLQSLCEPCNREKGVSVP